MELQTLFIKPALKFAGGAAAGGAIDWGTRKTLDKATSGFGKRMVLMNLDEEPELEELWVGNVMGAIGKSAAEASIDWGTKKTLDKANGFRKTGKWLI